MSNRNSFNQTACDTQNLCLTCKTPFTKTHTCNYRKEGGNYYAVINRTPTTVTFAVDTSKPVFSFGR